MLYTPLRLAIADGIERNILAALGLLDSEVLSALCSAVHTGRLDEARSEGPC